MIGSYIKYVIYVVYFDLGIFAILDTSATISLPEAQNIQIDHIDSAEQLVIIKETFLFWLLGKVMVIR